jgi:hypothetical protein
VLPRAGRRIIPLDGGRVHPKIALQLAKLAAAFVALLHVLRNSSGLISGKQLHREEREIFGIGVARGGIQIDAHG